MKFQRLIFGLSMAGLALTGMNTTWATPQRGNESTIALATQSQRIRFQQGTTSATIKDAIVRGEPPKTYVLDAGKGQKMTVRITSLEKNAVFRIIAPNGTIIVNAAKGDKILNNLPLAGDYRIEVGTERGNASYELYVSIVGSLRR